MAKTGDRYLFDERVLDGSIIDVFYPRPSSQSEFDYQYLRDLIDAQVTLPYGRTYLSYPPNYRRSDADEKKRRQFNPSRFALLAGAMGEDGDYGRILIVDNENPRQGYVISLPSFTIAVCFYQGFAVESDGEEVLSDLNMVSRLSSPNEEVEEEEEVEVETSDLISANFISTKKVKPRDLGYTKSSVIEEEEEPETEEKIEIERPGFSANSNKKPKTIVDERKKKVSKVIQPVEPKPVPEKKVEPFVPQPTFIKPSQYKPPVIGGVTSVNKSKNKSVRHYMSKADYRYLPGKGNRLLTYPPLNQEEAALFAQARERIGRIYSLPFTENCVFRPLAPSYDVSNDTPYLSFKGEDWAIVAISISAYSVPRSALLVDKETGQKAMVVLLKECPITVALSEEPIEVGFTQETSFDLFELTKKPLEVEKPIEDEPIEEEPIEVEEPVEEVEEEIEVATIKRKKKRMVFVSSSFEKDRAHFHEAYHQDFDRDLARIISSLTYLDEDELNDFFNANDGKNIKSSGKLTIRKFRIGNNTQYRASRIFFCRGYDYPGIGANSLDIMLLGISTNGEHDFQGDFAEKIISRLRAGKDFIFRVYSDGEDSSSIEKTAHMSKEQYGLLEEAKTKMPMAFLGSAGTGKTLISVRHAIDLVHQGKRVLYITYQKELSDEVKRQLRLQEEDEVEVLTFKQLATSLLGPEEGNSMETKRDFRSWFYSYVKKTHNKSKQLRALGDDIEDQFMISYTFYRGVIDGLVNDEELNWKSSMSQEEFIDLTKSEEGVDLEGKRVIFEIGEAYRQHLKDTKRKTDNQLAESIIELGEHGKRYDAIIIDEFQDLTEVQFLAIIGLLKEVYPLHLFIYGDENQAINPTIFGFDDANRILRRKYGSDVGFAKTELTSSYRSGPVLINFINAVNKVKTDCIGKRGDYDSDEVSLREDDKDLLPLRLIGEENLSSLIKTASDSDLRVAFIFPNATVLHRYGEKYAAFAEKFVETSFMTVGMSKGLQWDSVILVDFFSSSKKIFEAMLGPERIGHRSTIHRMLFNRFYVALTRAENRIIVYESEESPLIEDRILTSLKKVKDASMLEAYFKGSMQKGDWLKKGKEEFRSGSYLSAMRSFSRSSSDEAKTLYPLAKGYYEAFSENPDVEKSIKMFIEQGDLLTLLNFYDYIGEQEKYNFLYAIKSKEADAPYCHEFYLSLRSRISKTELDYFALLVAQKYLGQIDELQIKIKRRWNHG